MRKRIRAEIQPDGRVIFKDRTFGVLGETSSVGQSDEFLKNCGAVDVDDVEWVMVKKKRRKKKRRRDVVEWSSARKQGLPNPAGRNSCVAIACARAVAPDPTNNVQVAKLFPEVVRRFPRKPRRRGSKGWTPAGVYYGGADHALRAIGMPAQHIPIKTKPTVANFLEIEKYQGYKRGIIKIRSHVGFLYEDVVFDLRPRQHVKWFIPTPEERIPSWALEAIND